MYIKHLAWWLAKIKHPINSIYCAYPYRKDVNQPWNTDKWLKNLLEKSVTADG